MPTLTHADVTEQLHHIVTYALEQAYPGTYQGIIRQHHPDLPQELEELAERLFFLRLSQDRLDLGERDSSRFSVGVPRTIAQAEDELFYTMPGHKEQQSIDSPIYQAVKEIITSTKRLAGQAQETTQTTEPVEPIVQNGTAVATWYERQYSHPHL